MNRNYWTAFYTILTKEFYRFIRIWPQTLLPPVITTILYFLIFGKIIGDRVGDMAEGIGYAQYIAPGLIMMTVISNSYANVVSSFFSAKYSRHIEELLISPIPNLVIIAGYVGGGVARGFSVGLIVTAVTLFFVDLNIHSIPLMLSIFILTSLVFSLAGLINAIFARHFDDISIIPTFILTPLTYLGGVFYSVALLPEPWQSISYFNPILYMVNAFRYSILSVSDINITTALVLLGVFFVALFSLALTLLNRGIGLKS
ncbi:ABC transporter permease [Ignatzschineria sp. RMDPL8A]|uniref:ABC transporter permease n=1 Tax=Ignatzschineria sp. RMDPL8A TaxID=2999236 RepID=UPI0016B92D7E|nr:ABC transporter permease [Ignatzschineria sp. RMDPL8A]NLD08978.1 ABC transporter permease [Xanthomonadaceae bacterium]